MTLVDTFSRPEEKLINNLWKKCSLEKEKKIAMKLVLHHILIVLAQMFETKMFSKYVSWAMKKHLPFFYSESFNMDHASDFRKTNNMKKNSSSWFLNFWV